MKTQTITPENYPYLLKHAEKSPAYLNVAGTMPSDDNKFLCVIGARQHTSYGKEVCQRLIAGLAGHPIVIISGLALGIDSIAHESALKNGLKTISCPGSGLSDYSLYPVNHRKLAYKILESGGALVSPFPKEQTGTIWTFPVRNGLMAGMSHAVLIIEAGEDSGTLGTAQYATDFDRDILAVPGPIFSELSYGPHQLIREGATPITCSEDILEALDFAVTRKRKIEEPYKKRKSPTVVKTTATDTDLPKQFSINLDDLMLSPEEKTICYHLKNENMSATELIQKTSWSTSLLNITISELEMKNLVLQEGGSYKMRRV